MNIWMMLLRRTLLALAGPSQPPPPPPGYGPHPASPPPYTPPPYGPHDPNAQPPASPQSGALVPLAGAKTGPNGRGVGGGMCGSQHLTIPPSHSQPHKRARRAQSSLTQPLPAHPYPTAAILPSTAKAISALCLSGPPVPSPPTNHRFLIPRRPLPRGKGPCPQVLRPWFGVSLKWLDDLDAGGTNNVAVVHEARSPPRTHERDLTSRPDTPTPWTPLRSSQGPAGGVLPPPPAHPSIPNPLSPAPRFNASHRFWKGF